MRKRFHDKKNLQRDQQTEWFFPDESDAVRRNLSGESAELFMLADDVHNGILPIGHSHEEKWQVVIQAGSVQVEEIVACALDWEQHGYGLRDSLRKFISECARDIIRNGECVYELVKWKDPSSGEIELFEFMSVLPATLKYHRGHWQQHLPIHIAETRKKPQVIRIDKQRLIFFGLPTSAGAKLQYENMVRNLYSLGRNSISKIGMQALDPSTPNSERVPFDQTLNSLTRMKAAAEVTRHLGYNYRMRLHDQCGEYYFFMRELRFHRFKIEMRGAILARLNEALLTVETTAGPLGQIIIEGLPTIQDVDAAETCMREGTRSISDIMREFRFL
jgi:hypothetical protein